MMKKILLMNVILALTACSAIPTQAPQPTSVAPTAQVIIATVLVPVEVTSVVTEVPQPTATTLPPTQIPATQAAAVEETAPAAGIVPVTGGLIAVDPKFNGQSFEKVTVSGDKFSLRCNPKEITFDVYSTDKYIVRTDLYYRIRDKHSDDVPSWAIAGIMETDGLYHFWFTMNGENVPPDLRKHQGWFDFQFVGINKLGNAVGRSEKITDIVSYTIDC